MDDTTRPVRDWHQFCCLCHFHFWRLTRVFYLGRFEDLVLKANLDLPHPYGEHPDSKAVVLLGDHYYVRYDPSINSMTWQLLVRPERQAGGTRWHPPLEPENTASGWPVFPLCRDCFWVTREFLIHRNSVTVSRPAVMTLDALYGAIYSQWQRSCQGKELGQARWKLNWDHGSFRGPFVAYDRWERTARTTLYNEGETDENIEDWHWLVENPYRPLPSLPEFLLKHLEPVPTSESRDTERLRGLGPSAPEPKSVEPVINAAHASTSWKDDSKTTILSMPTEVLQLIASELDPVSCFNLRLSCRLFASIIALDQQFWYQALICNGLFGFFFDFDSMKVLEETRRKCLKRRRQPPWWDWKRLVGELAHFSSFQNGGVLADAPGAFRNRRRIWRILETAESQAKHGEGMDIAGGMESKVVATTTGKQNSEITS